MMKVNMVVRIRDVEDVPALSERLNVPEADLYQKIQSCPESDPNKYTFIFELEVTEEQYSQLKKVHSI
jgi:hypothetical protein